MTLGWRSTFEGLVNHRINPTGPCVVLGERGRPTGESLRRVCKKSFDTQHKGKEETKERRDWKSIQYRGNLLVVVLDVEIVFVLDAKGLSNCPLRSRYHPRKGT